MLLYTVAAWIASSRVLIGQHYFTDAVGGAILGTVFPFIVRERFAFRRWLFEPLPRRRLSASWRADAKLAWLAKGFACGKI